MTRWLLASYIGLATFVLVILIVPLGITFARAERDRLVAAVERDATVVAGLAEDALEHDTPPPVTETLQTYFEDSGGRVVVVDAQGISVADSTGQTARDYSTRPEVAIALSGETAAGTRFSDTLSEGLLYVAVPVTSGGTVHGAVRITYPTTTVDARIRSVWVGLLVVGTVVLLAAATISLILARWLGAPVGKLTAGSHAMASGDLSVRVRPGGPAELRELGRAFNTMAAQLDGLVQSQQAFVADASHQLRSPLAALRLRLENLEASVRSDERPELTSAIDETVRLSRLVEGLLTLARADEAPQAATAVDIAAVLADRAAMWEPLAAEQGVGIVVTGRGIALVTPGSVDQIADNLIANALAVSPPGSDIRLSVTDSSPAGADLPGQRDQILFSISDGGPGMTPEQQARAFDRFWRGAAATHRGFGLGLPIVRRLAEASGGGVALGEADSGGLRVDVWLPKAELPLATPQPA